jgi:lipid II:glycine glycyltransferase (peptidoglycan interpeptide bridge formation enzyme)
VYALQVLHKPSREVIATGIFPHDDRHVYSISTASRLHARSLYPNELLYWTAMDLAGRSGMQELSIGDNYRTPASGGKFKDKFNGDYVPVYRYLRNYSSLAKYAREGYRILTRCRQRLAGLAPGRVSGV